jgi:hypothetical protein
MILPLTPFSFLVAHQTPPESPVLTSVVPCAVTTVCAVTILKVSTTDVDVNALVHRNHWLADLMASISSIGALAFIYTYNCQPWFFTGVFHSLIYFSFRKRCLDYDRNPKLTDVYVVIVAFC